MTTKYKARAFVFKKCDRNDADRIFSVFTDEFGRLDVHAKAIRKITSKLRSGLDVFSISDLEFIQGKNKKTLTDAARIKKYSNIWRDSDRLKIASNIGEILENFIKGQEKDEKIFLLLDETFCRLDDECLKKEKYELVYLFFLWNALSLLGYKCQADKCAACQNKLVPQGLYFSSREGGVICEQCSGKDRFSKKINSDIVKILRVILKKDWQTLSRLKIESSSQKLLEEISENYCSYLEQK